MHKEPLIFADKCFSINVCYSCKNSFKEVILPADLRNVKNIIVVKNFVSLTL